MLVKVVHHVKVKLGVLCGKARVVGPCIRFDDLRQLLPTPLVDKLGEVLRFGVVNGLLKFSLEHQELCFCGW